MDNRCKQKGFDGERGYNQGYDFGLYLHQKFERPVMTEMAKASAKSGLELGQCRRGSNECFYGRIVFGLGRNQHQAI